MDAAVLMDDGFWHGDRPLVMAAEGVVAPDRTALPGLVFFQTSGSTGAAKWIGHSRQGLLKSAEVVNAHLGVGASSCWGLLLPLHHVGGFGVVARARQAACRLAVISGRWQPQLAVDALRRERVTHASLVPTQVFDLVQCGLRAPESLVAVVVGGGRLSNELGQAARDLGWPVLASYGMTEAGSQVATQGLLALQESYQAAPIPVLPHWRVEVDANGLLRLAGESLFAGWLEMRDGSWVYEPRDGEWFQTRDRVRMDNGCLWPEGRADLQVKVLGELVQLEVIEDRLRELAGDDSALGPMVVVAVPDARAEHVLVPVFDRCSMPQRVDEVWKTYQQEAPGYARLAAPVFLESLPCSGLGKPLRMACLEQVLARREG